MDTPTELVRVYLIRHGDTAWSKTGQHTGRTDLPLTEDGERHSRRLGEHLGGVTFSHVFCSPLLRARQTCQWLGWEAVEIEPDVTEWNYGDYEGLTSAEILKNRPDWSLFRDGCPHGEMPAEVSNRADRFIARLRQLHGNIAVCSHGHFGRVLGARWIGLPVAHAKFVLRAASLSVLGFEHDRATEPVIELWNLTAHELSERATSSAAGTTPASGTPAVDQWENEGGEIPQEPDTPAGS